MPAVFVTVTSTVAGVSVAGELTVIEVDEFTTGPLAVVRPNFTVDAAVKFVPEIVTDVPPPVGPEVGLIDVTVGVTAL